MRPANHRSDKYVFGLYEPASVANAIRRLNSKEQSVVVTCGFDVKANLSKSQQVDSPQLCRCVVEQKYNGIQQKKHCKL